MDPFRYRNSPTKEKSASGFPKSPSSSGFDDTTSSLKDSFPSKLNAMKFPSEPHSPNEDVVINFQTDNLYGGDSQTMARTTTGGEGHLLSRVTTMGQGQGDRLLTPVEEIMPPNLLEEETILRLINNSVFYILRINTISLILFGLLTLAITWGISYMYAVGFLWMIDAFELLQMLTHSRKYRATAKSAIKKVWSCLNPILKTLASAGSKALLVLYIYRKSFPLMLCVLPAGIYEISTSLSAISKSKQKTMKKIHLSLLIIKALLVLSGLTGAMKLEHKIAWEWRDALLGYWILFAIFCGFTLVAVLCLVNRCCVFFFADSEQFQVYGVIWGAFILAGKALLSCLLVISLKESYEAKLTAESLLTPFFIVMGYNLVMLLFTLGYYTEIETFFKDLAAIDDEYEYEQTQTYEMDTKENQQKKTQKVVVPKFLTKSSSTYYRVTTDNEINEVKQKRKKRQERQKEKQREKEKDHIKQKQIERDPKKVRSPKQARGLDYVKMAKEGDKLDIPNFRSRENDMLNTIAETDQDRKTYLTEMDKRGIMSAKSKREDKGKDFFSSLTNKTGVLGIVPSVVKGLGLSFKSRRGYAAQEDPEEGEEDDRGANFNQSCDFTGGVKSPRRTRHALTVRLEKKGRGQLDKKGLETLEARLREIDLSQSNDERNARDRLAQSMYNKPGAENFSAVFDQDESSVIEETAKGPKSGDNSMTQQCLICFDKPPDAVFMNCGHGGVCYDCSVEIWKATEECYLCREKIAQVLQIDLKSKLEGDVIKVLSSTQMVNWEQNLEESG